MAWAISFFASRAFSDSRLSWRFFPFAIPSSILTLFFALKYSFVGTRVTPSVLIRYSSFKISLRWSSNFLSRFSCGLKWGLAVSRWLIWIPKAKTSPWITLAKLSLRLIRPARIALTSLPTKTIPTSKVVKISKSCKLFYY